MKKYNFILFCLFMVNGGAVAQSCHIPTDWKQVRTDCDTLLSKVNSLKEYLTQFIVRFDFCLINGNNSMYNGQLGNSIKDTSVITASIRGIEDYFYKDKKTPQHKKTSQDDTTLWYLINKELDDYENSLTTFKDEIGALMNASRLNAFSNNNFLNAYHYVCISRSLLLARIDNVEDLGENEDKYAEIERKLNGINALLSEPFQPYYGKNNGLYKSTQKYDKINGAGNGALYDNRKNGWWRALIAGVVGGLCAGLLVHAAK